MRDVLARLPGMGDVRVFGAGDYSMRVWLDPQKLAARNLTTGDVVDAIREQNVQVAAGPDRRAAAARPLNSRWRSTPRAASQDEDQFRDIIIKTGDDGEDRSACATSRASSWARSDYALRSLLDNKNAVAHARLPGARLERARALQRAFARRWRR